MSWTVEVTTDFERWWNQLSEEERISIDGMIRVVEKRGPDLGAPYSTEIAGSDFAPELRQLIVPHEGRRICVLYICEWARSRLVLLTGSVVGTDEDACPPDSVAAADLIYRDYVERRDTAR